MAHILLYGGTFDPIHLGHLITCRAARELLDAKSVLLLPARLSPHKKGEPPGATPEQRLEMIRLAIAGAADFAVDPRELSRPGPSYTVDTVRELKRDRPDDRFTLLLGADQLAKLHTWHDAEGLLGAVGVAVLRRSGAEPVEAGLDKVRQHLGAEVGKHLHQALLPTPLVDISSSMIRERIGKSLPIDYLVTTSVMNYILANNLYRLASEP